MSVAASYKGDDATIRKFAGGRMEDASLQDKICRGGSQCNDGHVDASFDGRQADMSKCRQTADELFLVLRFRLWAFVEATAYQNSCSRAI